MANGYRRLIWYLYPSQLLVALAVLLAVSWLAGTSARNFYMDQLEVDLGARAHLLHEAIIELLPLAAAPDFFALADPHFVRQLALLQDHCRSAGAASSTRITVVALNGLVLADSEQEPRRMENHGNRPEIMAALMGRIGRDVRFGPSIHHELKLMYVAIPLVREGDVIGALRTAVPLIAIDEALVEIHRRIAISGLLIAMLVVVVTWFIARRLSRPLEEMRLGAERFAAGEFGGRIAEGGAEELVGLARAMNRMAEQLDQRLRIIDRQRNQLQAVFTGMVEGVLTVSADELILDLNHASAEMLDVRPQRTKGQNIQVAIRNSGLLKLIRETLANSEPREGEFTLLDERGRERFFRAQGSRLPNLTGEGSGAVLVISDVTKLRRLESMRRDFVANVSHELKTPITSIVGFAETLLDGALAEPEEACRFVSIIFQQSCRLHAIVEDLLTLSRIEQEGLRQAVPLQELPLLATIRAAIQSCTQRAEARNMSLQLLGAENLRAWLNPALMEQALINLVDNAVKYAPTGSPIVISAEATDKEIIIEVRDQGPGIPAASLPRIFERFYRVDKARSASLGGTGLGLAIVKHIVEAHRGHISVTSQVGRGSTFTVHLPKVMSDRLLYS